LSGHQAVLPLLGVRLELVSPKLWEQYYAMQEEILNRMRDAQKLATEIAREIKSQISDKPA
jgi:hypothetical protein